LLCFVRVDHWIHLRNRALEVGTSMLSRAKGLQYVEHLCLHFTEKIGFVFVVVPCCCPSLVVTAAGSDTARLGLIDELID
jgi:hypothetical protein